MKASEVKPNKNNTPTKGPIQGFGPSSFRNQNKSLLEKYSFEDNDLSRTSQLISEMNQEKDEEEWLRLEIKEITSIGKELITFYLAVKYLVEYQGEMGHNFDKKKAGERQGESVKDVKELKSKLVHGSILQTEHKNLTLNLKCKKNQFLPFGTKPYLTRLQFQIMRMFQTNTQPVLIAKQIINNPQNNAQYEIAFQEFSPQVGAQTKSVVAMIFEINGGIEEEIDGDEESQGDEVSEHLEGEEDEKFENYTLGKSQPFKQSQKKKPQTQHNIFDTNHEDSQQDINKNEDNDPSRLQQSSLTNKRQSSGDAELIHKLNELSNMMDENLEKSKNEDQAYRSYLEETSNVIQRFNRAGGEQGSSGKAKIDNMESGSSNNVKSNQADNNDIAQVKHNTNKNPTHPSHQQQQPTNPNKTPDDTSSLNQRYNYISRIDNTYITGQRFPYQSRINNSNSANTDNEKHHYFSKAEITNNNNNNTAGEKYMLGLKGDDSNIVGERYNYESRMDETNVVGERDSEDSRIEKSNILDESNLNDLSAIITPLQPNTPMHKKLNLSKKQPFLKFNAKKQNHQLGNSSHRDTSQNQPSSRNFPFNLGDLDSSNIRYQYNDNDVSNIQETKNMQDLINQIQKIEKQWYQKRVLNRKNRQEKKDYNKEDEENKLKPFDLASNPDDVLDLELKNFKIKFSQQTFYRKLIDGLKRKHQNYAKRNQANENGESEIPKNYFVFLIANEVDDQSMDFDAGNTSKIQIKIPSQQIDKLLQLQSIEKQRSLSNSGSNGLSPTMSKIQEKQIIKTFEKQLFSKVMKIKLSKNDKNGIGEKKKARIIEISLEDQSLTLSQLQINGTMKDPQQNRISLIGMYPLPIFGSDNKDGETSFYQNVSIEPLAIELYDTKTGAQEGQLKFELTKAKVDREIQTLQPLENMDQPQESNQIHQENLSLLVGYEVQDDKNLHQGLASQKKSIKKSQTESKLKQRILDIEIIHSFGKGTLTNIKAQQNNANRQLKIQSQASIPLSLQSEQLPFKQLKNDQELLSSISKARHKSIHQVKTAGFKNKSQSPKKEKDVDAIGKIVKNQSSLLIEVHPVIAEKDKESNVKTVQKRNNSQDQKPKLIPELHMSNIKRVNDPNSDRRYESNSPGRFYNTSSRNHEIIPNSPSSINQKNDPQSDSSYILMKQQFLATANLLESIKMKAQEFIDKVESERKIHTSDELLHSDKEGSKEFDSQGQSKVAYTLPIEKKAINLEVTSFVINQTVMSRRQVSRNTQTLAQPNNTTPQTINPKATSNMQSKRTSTNKSRNSKIDQNVISARRNKYIVVGSDRQREQRGQRGKEYEKDVELDQGRKERRREKPKKTLVYKEESDYMFTEEEDSVRKGWKGNDDNKPYLSTNKILDQGQQSDMSNQLQSSGLTNSHLPASLYPKGTFAAKPSYRNIKQSAISSYSQQQLIEIKLFSLKIKLLTLPLVAKHLRNFSEDILKGKEYFVLVYTDFSEGERGFMTPVSQKCVRKKLGKEDQFVVLFGDSKEDSVKGKKTQGFLLLKGVEKTKFVVQLYHLLQHLPISKKSYEKDVTSLQHISLITLSPQHKKPKTKPFASLSVTFIELLAQQESGGLTSRLQKSDLITYTNFLYEKDKILGKININYITQMQDDNDRGSNYEGSRAKHKISVSRKQAIDQFKPLKNSYFKNYPDTKKHSQYQKDNDLKKLRSESGMTKKLTPRRKMQARMSEQYSQNERSSLPVKTLGNQADPLQILKRKVPRPIKSQEKTSKHSLSYAIRLNRPYHTPMNKIKGKDLFESLNSSSSAQFKGDNIRDHRHKNSVYSSSQFEGEGFNESPKKGQDNTDLMQLRQKKQEKKLKRLKEYQAASKMPIPYQQTQETRLSQNRRYDGGNIKFGKSSRFNSADSQELLSKKGSKAEIPGPGHYEVKSSFDRHMIKEP